MGAGERDQPRQDHEGRRQKLSQQFGLRAQAVDVIHQAEEHHRHRPHEDARRYLHRRPGAGKVVVRPEEHRDRDAGDPAQEDRHPAQIGDRLGMDLALVVRVVHHAVAMGQRPHQGRKHDGHEEGHVEHRYIRPENRRIIQNDRVLRGRQHKLP